LQNKQRWYDYGLGAGEVVVVVEVSVAVSLPGDAVAVVLVFVVVALCECVDVVAGDGLMTVVLFSVFVAGEAPVVVVGWTSVRCSQAVSSAALARMQMVFFIVGVCFVRMGLTRNRTNPSIRPCLVDREAFVRVRLRATARPDGRNEPDRS
jgi:hypothetical protein